MARYMIKERFVRYGINHYVFEAFELKFFDLIKIVVAGTYARTLEECRSNLLGEIERVKKSKKHELHKQIIEIE